MDKNVCEGRESPATAPLAPGKLLEFLGSWAPSFVHSFVCGSGLAVSHGSGILTKHVFSSVLGAMSWDGHPCFLLLGPGGP